MTGLHRIADFSFKALVAVDTLQLFVMVCLDAQTSRPHCQMKGGQKCRRILLSVSAPAPGWHVWYSVNACLDGWRGGWRGTTDLLLRNLLSTWSHKISTLKMVSSKSRHFVVKRLAPSGGKT